MKIRMLLAALLALQAGRAGPAAQIVQDVYMANLTFGAKGFVELHRSPYPGGAVGQEDVAATFFWNAPFHVTVFPSTIGTEWTMVGSMGALGKPVSMRSAVVNGTWSSKGVEGSLAAPSPFTCAGVVREELPGAVVNHGVWAKRSGRGITFIVVAVGDPSVKGSCEGGDRGGPVSLDLMAGEVPFNDPATDEAPSDDRLAGRFTLTLEQLKAASNTLAVSGRYTGPCRSTDPPDPRCRVSLVWSGDIKLVRQATM
jgi:hypothetical protein